MVGDLVRGVYDGLRGAAYLLRAPRLWVWVLAPLVVAGILLVSAVGGLVGLLSAPIATISAFMPGDWLDNVLELAAGIVLTIASLSIYLSVAALIAAPFNEELSEAIEERETGVPGPRFRFFRFLYDIVIGIIHASRRVFVYLVVMLLLLIVGIAVPVIGTAIAAVLGFIATARFASYDAFDAVWARKRRAYHAKVDYLRENRWRTLAMGGVIAPMLLVPGLNVIGLAVGATAATLRVIDQEKERSRASALATRS
jgi:CysZ protein